MKTANLYDYPLTPGRYMIEASAGTGKTWTITNLFRRLVLEEKIPVSKILVTTFSKVAAAELKDRITKELNTALREGWEDRNGKNIQPDEDQKLLLQLAVTSMDRICIGTIHGICRKFLQDFALDTGSMQDRRLQADSNMYAQTLTNAFCRQELYGRSHCEEVVTEKGRMEKVRKCISREPQQITPGPEENICSRLLMYLNRHIEDEKERNDVRDFNDLIQDFLHALRGPNGPLLAQKIQKQFQAVFVDEFQDTDADQFEIFDSCFPKNSRNIRMYLIGDPKQAIYEFRGADIYTYLKAREMQGNEIFTLTKNFRSSGESIRMVNTLFSDGDFTPGHETPGAFLQENIPFVSIEPGKAGKFHWYEKGELRQTALRVCQLKTEKVDKERILDSVASEIRYLLSEDSRIEFDDGENKKKIKASDIAVLLPSHDDIADLQRILNELGIAASACKSGRVYESAEAELMLVLLQTSLHPEESGIRLLMLSPFFRISAEEILAENRTELLQDHLRDFAIRWKKQGLPAAFLSFLDSPVFQERAVPRQQILAESGGERTMTNLLQIMEQLHESAVRDGKRPEDILVSLEQFIHGNAEPEKKASTEGSSEDNPEQMRLDRDDESVQLCTMFAAKGLEYPVVFIPIPGSKYYNPDQSVRVKKDGITCVDFGGEKSLAALAKTEFLRSKLRLLYVALTRAKYLTYLYLPFTTNPRSTKFMQTAQGALLVSPQRFAEDAAGEQKLTYLLKARNLPDDPPEWYKTLFSEPPSADIWNNLFERFPEQREVQAPSAAAPEAEPVCRKLPVIPGQWRIMSFSAYHNSSADENSAAPGLDESGGEPEKPDAGEAEEPVSENRFLLFPRGVTVGTMVHEILEKIARSPEGFSVFRTWPLIPDLLRRMFSHVLRSYGFDPEELAGPLEEGIAGALQTPLQGYNIDIPLTELNPELCMPEHEFLLDAPNSLNLKRILDIMRENASVKVRSMVPRDVPSSEMRGMLNGFIDLIFKYQGRYYLLDWKTNWLGPAQEDYSQSKLRAAMIEKNYILQCYLYCTALLKIFRQRRIPEESFGGMFYLFPRGTNGKTGSGIWYDRPPLECLHKLLELFRGDDK